MDEETQILCSQPISDELMIKLEEAACDRSRGQQRKLVLLACNQTLEKLCEIRLTEQAAFNEMRGSVEAFKAHAQGLLEIAETACFRLKLADSLGLEDKEFERLLETGIFDTDLK